MIVTLNIPSFSHNNFCSKNQHPRQRLVTIALEKQSPVATDNISISGTSCRGMLFFRGNTCVGRGSGKEEEHHHIATSLHFKERNDIRDAYHPTIKRSRSLSMYNKDAVHKPCLWVHQLSKIVLFSVVVTTTTIVSLKGNTIYNMFPSTNDSKSLSMSSRLFLSMAVRNDITNELGVDKQARRLARVHNEHHTASAIEDNPSPKVVWLMSFPNSGTSFIIHMTREATNCTTATNYGLEGDIRDQPSIQAIQGPVGANGPWLELLRTKTTHIAHTILTKTHCKGFCSGRICDVDRTIHTSRSFMMGCLTGNQGVLSNHGLYLTDKTYDKSLVKKAIHIFRHPLDNIVARFHLEYNEKNDTKNTKFTTVFPKNATGFRRWCYIDDQNRQLIRSRFVDARLRNFMLQIPCFNEFYRYTQWHNLAFETISDMRLPSMVLHYHEFSQNFTNARDRILDFLEVPLVGEGIRFDDGKVYRNYYTTNERMNIRQFLKEFASADTWAQLQQYSFVEDAGTAVL